MSGKIISINDEILTLIKEKINKLKSSDIFEVNFIEGLCEGNSIIRLTELKINLKLFQIPKEIKWKN